MANWEATTQSTVIDTSAAATAAMTAREATRSASSVGGGGFNLGSIPIIGGLLGGGSGFSIVGIDATKVKDMRDQIGDSVLAIQTYLDGIEAQTNSSNAFRSEDIKAAVEKYVDAIKDYCKALISDLLAFSDKLQEVKEAWERSTQNFASDSIQSSNESLAGATDYYKETMQR